MTVEEAVDLFRRKRPRSLLEAMKKTYLSFRYQASGSFRDTFRINTLPLIAKFPVGDDLDQEIKHAEKEIQVYRRVLRNKKLEPIRRYMPKILYSNCYGVTLMPEYEVFSLPELTEDMDKIAGEIKTALDTDWDDNFDNFGKDTNGNIVLLDLGCLAGDFGQSGTDELS